MNIYKCLCLYGSPPPQVFLEKEMNLNKQNLLSQGHYSI